MQKDKRITIRLTDADRKFLHTAGGGGGRGAIQAGFDQVVRFARLMPLTFSALLGGMSGRFDDADWFAAMEIGVEIEKSDEVTE